MNIISKFFKSFNPLWVPINLNELAKIIAPNIIEKNPFLNAQWVDDLLGAIQLPCKTHTCTYGGFLEDRSHLWRGHYFKNGAIHLGVDINAPQNVNVVLPCDGKLVESFQDPDQDGGWGGKLTFDCNGFFLTFGHLDGILTADNIGKTFNAGDDIGLVATRKRNGGWYQHLHVQASKIFDPNRDGYAETLYDGIEKDFFDPIEVVKLRSIA